MQKQFRNFNYLILIVIILATFALFQQHMITQDEMIFMLVVTALCSVGLRNEGE